MIFFLASVEAQRFKIDSGSCGEIDVEGQVFVVTHLSFHRPTGSLRSFLYMLLNMECWSFAILPTLAAGVLFSGCGVDAVSR